MFGRKQRARAGGSRLYRRGLIAPIVAALLGLVPLSSAVAETDDWTAVDSWLDSVVLLVSGPAYCSGVLIDDVGTVATAYHCVANGLQPQVRTRSGERFVGRSTATSARGIRRPSRALRRRSTMLLHSTMTSIRGIRRLS